MKKAYIDTCVVSEKIKRERDEDVLVSIDAIFDAYRQGQIELYASEKVKAELDGIPGEFRNAHIELFETLKDLPVLKVIRKYRLSPLILPIANVRYRQKQRIDNLLKGDDRWHVFVAVSNRVEYLITIDESTILRHRDAVAEATGVKVVSPSEFLDEISNNAT